MQTGLFALFHASISSEVTTIAKSREEFFVVTEESPSQAHANSSRLAGVATTRRTYQDIYVRTLLARIEYVQDPVTILLFREVLFEVASVHRDLAATGTNTNTSDRRLTSSGSKGIAVFLVFFCCDHLFRYT